MTELQSRKQLEQDVIDAIRQVMSGIDIENPNWVFDGDMERLREVFRALVRYYTISSDMEINVLVIAEYVEAFQFFQNMITDEFDPSSGVYISPEVKKQAQRYIDLLEYFLHETIREVQKTYNNLV